MLITGVQAEQLRILQAHGQLTTARMSHILDHRADALEWVAENWQGALTAKAELEVRQVAFQALTFITNGAALTADE